MPTTTIAMTRGEVSDQLSSGAGRWKLVFSCILPPYFLFKKMFPLFPFIPVAFEFGD
jgi:hypothetical protein